MCISEREAGLLVSGQKGGGPSPEPQPLLGVRAERMKPVIREVRGRKLSAGVGIVLGAGGWDGSLVPQITRPLAAIVAEWKGPMGGSQGWGGNSEQWSVGERSSWVRRDGDCVCVWGGAFIQLFPSSLLTAHPEPGSYGLLNRQWIHRVCVWMCVRWRITHHICISHRLSGFCVFVLPRPAAGKGGGLRACRLNSKGWHLSQSSAQSQDLSLVRSVLRGRVTQIMGTRREKTKDQSFPLYWRSWTEPLTACHSSEHQTTNRTQYI